MNQIAALLLLALGLVLLACGINAFNSLDSSLSRLLTGASSDTARWLLVGGGVVAAAGIGGFLRGAKA